MTGPGHVFGARDESERDAWKQQREDWRRTNTADDNPEK